MTELTRRVLFSLVAIPVAFGIIYLGGLPLALLLAVIAGIAAWELLRIARAGGIEAIDLLAIPLAAALPLLAHAHQRGVVTAPLSLGALAVLVVMAVAIWERGVEGRPLAAAAITVLAVVYTGGMLSFGYGLRYHRYVLGAAAGTALVLFPMLLTWASDTGAYFVGRAVGRRKLIPAVSPGKTVEGALGGLLLTIVVCWAYNRWVLVPVARVVLSPMAVIGVGALLSVAAQIGDLVESLFKREAGVKDSSRIIPGHGGVLDRFDSLFFVLPVAALALERLLRVVPR